MKCEVTSDHSNDPTKRGKTDTNSHERDVDARIKSMEESFTYTWVIIHH